VLAGLVAGAAIGLAGCGGPSPTGVASLGQSSGGRGNPVRTTTTVAESSLPEKLQFARCMRSNGVPNFPDPKPGTGELQNIANAGVTTGSAAYQAAFQACKKYTPAGQVTPQSAADQAKALQFSQCMRAHGVPNFPDPVTGPTGAPAINLGPEHIDPSSPLVGAANQACQRIVPGTK
jgi:hypothetical protein